MGKIVRDAREGAGIAIEKFSQLTSIPVRHLECLEDDRYQELPPDVYVKAMIKKYVRYFSLDADLLFQKLAAARNPQSAGRSDALPSNRFRGDRRVQIPLPEMSWHPGLILFVVGGLWLLLQARALFFVPRIDFHTPEVVEDMSAVIRLGGRAKGARAITVNGKEVTAKRNGSFSSEVFLIPGMNTVEVRARNYLGRETKKTKFIMYRLKPTPESLSTVITPPVVPSATESPRPTL